MVIDTEHTDTEHTDTERGDIEHTDTEHTDTEHTDTGHTDTERGDIGRDDLERREVLTGRLGEIAGHLNVLHAELVDITVELLASEGWRQGGKSTPSAFLQWQLGLSKGRADDVVRVAERASQFPVLLAGFRRGEFSLEQVAAAVEAPGWADALVVDFVRISTVAKIRRAMRSNMFTGDPEAPEPEPVVPKDRLSFGATRGGRWKISGEFDLDDGRRIEAALTERRDALFTDGDETVTWAEAFADCMERSLDAVASSSRRDRFRTWLHLDVSDGEATTTDGWQIPMAIRDQICCDGVVQPVWHRDGVPFSVGRAQHIVPDRTRRIVELRDRGCRVPGCGRDRFVEIHHIVHWNDGGPTDTWNLVCLCAKHHKLHHQGLLGINGDADCFDGLVFTDPVGRPLTGAGPPIPPTGPPPTPQVAYRAPLAGRFDWNWIGLGWVHPIARRQRMEQAKQLAAQYHRDHRTHTAA